jgi:hypothetical protein
MKKKYLLKISIFLFSLTSFGQTKKYLNIDYMLRGYIYASSAIVDTSAPGGFGESDNEPQKLDHSFKFKESGFFLVVDTNAQTTFAKEYYGLKLYIVNRSDTVVNLDASDSRLDVIAEAFIDNKWQPIEYLPSSWCGNSYHTVYLKSDQYWEFIIPQYKGKLKTTIRYKLSLANNKFLYSNKFSASINRKQLTDKQGHSPKGLMDPYNE